MAVTTFRANLNSGQFPFMSELLGRTVLIPQQDQSYVRFATQDPSSQYALEAAQAYYMHNVMPSAQGYISIPFRQLAVPPGDTDKTFTSVNVIRDNNGNKAYLGTTSSGRCYILQNYLSGWLRTTDIVMPAGAQQVSTAFVQGVTYIYFQGIGCYTYNFSTNVLTSVTLTSLNPALITGLIANNGYLIAYGPNAVAWSSQVTITDFTPSLITGAGGGNVQDAFGKIVTCLPNKTGFLVYTQYNIVAAIFTGNPRYPFNFKPVIDSGGMASNQLIGYEPENTEQYAYTTDGLQVVTSQGTNTVFPECTDFLAGGYFEDFDDVNLVFNRTFVTSPLLKKLTVIANRYLCISYGMFALTHCLIYDISLRRWGKLKIQHVECFEYLMMNTDQVDTPRQSVAFLQADGTIILAMFAMDNPLSNGTILFGRYQLQEGNMCTVHEVVIDAVRPDSNLRVYDFTSLDGIDYTATPVKGFLRNLSSLTRTYCFRNEAMNHSILMQGQFNLVSLVLRLTEGGVR